MAKRLFQKERSLTGVDSLGISVFLGEIYTNTGFPCGNLADLDRLALWCKKVGFNSLWLGPIWLMDPQIGLAPYSVSSRLFIDPLYLPDFESRELPGAILDRDIQSDIEYEHNLGKVLWARRAETAKSYLVADLSRLRANPLFSLDVENWLRTELTDDMLGLLADAYFKIAFWDQPQDKPNRSDLIEKAVAAQAIGYGYLRKINGIIALGLDLPVGVSPNGIDSEEFSNWTIKDGQIGAPPDFFNANGQRWGLTGFSFSANSVSIEDFAPLSLPLKLYSTVASAVRIDHAIGLERLCVIRENTDENDEWYYFVHQPRQAMLDLLVELTKSLHFDIVAEDLGVVPETLRHSLVESGIALMKVLCFEDHELAQQHGQNMAMLTTHDAPTAAWLITADEISDEDEKLMANKLKMHANRVFSGPKVEISKDFRSIVCHSGQYETQTNEYLESWLPRLVSYLLKIESKFAVISLRDLLADQNRLNRPGTSAVERLNFFQALSLGASSYAKLLELNVLFEVTYVDTY